MRRRQALEVAIASASDPAVQDRLVTAARARHFAFTQLGLPDNGSYRTYAALDRPYVAWNVVATPEFSLQPVQSCFPFAGCLPYRGFFRESAAREHAAWMASEGHDVFLGPVAAYSTLGWFSDPLLSSMLRSDQSRTVRVMFHELAHQKVYVPDDPDFNEAFAEFVGREGWLEWAQSEGDGQARLRAEQAAERERQLVELMLLARDRLGALYGMDLAENEMRARKRAVFRTLQGCYEELKSAWGGYEGYDAWVQEDLNNAKLAATATYFRLVDRFAALFAMSDRDWPEFHRRVGALAALDPAQRLAYLTGLGGERTVSIGNCAVERVSSGN